MWTLVCLVHVYIMYSVCVGAVSVWVLMCGCVVCAYEVYACMRVCMMCAWIHE